MRLNPILQLGRIAYHLQVLLSLNFLVSKKCLRCSNSEDHVLIRRNWRQYAWMHITRTNAREHASHLRQRKNRRERKRDLLALFQALI